MLVQYSYFLKLKNLNSSYQVLGKRNIHAWTRKIPSILPFDHSLNSKSILNNIDVSKSFIQIIFFRSQNNDV